VRPWHENRDNFPTVLPPGTRPDSISSSFSLSAAGIASAPPLRLPWPRRVSARQPLAGPSPVAPSHAAERCGAATPASSAPSLGVLRRPGCRPPWGGRVCTSARLWPRCSRRPSAAPQRAAGGGKGRLIFLYSPSDLMEWRRPPDRTAAMMSGIPLGPVGLSSPPSPVRCFAQTAPGPSQDTALDTRVPIPCLCLCVRGHLHGLLSSAGRNPQTMPWPLVTRQFHIPPNLSVLTR
jgi:hypothetical protein